VIGPIAQEGVQQIAVGAVQLHAVESSIEGPHRGMPEVSDDARDFVERERTWRRAIDEALTSDERLGVRPDSRRTDRGLAILLEAGVRDPTRVPQLHDDGSTFGMDRVCDLPPAFHLGL
jgi:hypothetical protein